jgi:creatinine amidohydrolase
MAQGKGAWRSHYWADYTSAELAQLGQQGAIAIVPVAAIEQHGPHLPVSVDTCIIEGLVGRMQARFVGRADAPPALFLPCMPYGKSNEHAQYPGTIVLSTATLMSVWMEIGRSIAASGFKKIMFFNSHGGQASVMDLVARDLREQCGMIATHCNWYMLGQPDGLFSAEELRFGVHAGEVETSLMLALDPANVQQHLAGNFASSSQALLQQGFTALQVSPAAKISWMVQDLNKSGAVGNAAAASAQKGEALLAHTVQRFEHVLQEFAALPESYLTSLR